MKKEPTDPGYILRGISASDFTRRLSALKNLNPQTLSEDQIFQRLERALDGYVLHPVEFNAQAVVRARVNTPNKLYDKVSDLWYPPATVVQQRGRFNRQGESVFYCTDVINAALIEIVPPKACVATVLVAGLKSRSMLPKCVHIGIQHTKPHGGFVSTIPGGLRSDQNFLSMLRKLKIEKRWLYLDEVCADIATKPSTDNDEHGHYKISGALSRFLQRGEFSDGLIYPSVAVGYRAINLALKPQKADDLFFAAEAWMVHVDPNPTDIPEKVKHPSKLYKIEVLRRSESISHTGDISWSDQLPDGSPLEMLRYPSRIEEHRSARGVQD